MGCNEPDIRMPELARSVIHSEGVNLITEWIKAISSNNCI